jgi:hypothetical protein
VFQTEQVFLLLPHLHKLLRFIAHALHP